MKESSPDNLRLRPISNGVKYKFGNKVVVALGGSIIHPDNIDTKFIKKFRQFILDRAALGTKFVIVTGGGSVARDYQKAASEIVELENEDKDYLGIHATRLNAHFLRTIFFEHANPVVIDKRFKVRDLNFPISIASGWKPGWSTDYVALQLAHDFSAKKGASKNKICEVIIAGNISHVYDKDPKKFSGAKPTSNISWKNYRKIIPAKWTPGAHSPVDPIGAKLADENDLKAIIIKGTDLKNFGNLLAGNEFEGTIIE